MHLSNGRVEQLWPTTPMIPAQTHLFPLAPRLIFRRPMHLRRRAGYPELVFSMPAVFNDPTVYAAVGLEVKRLLEWNLFGSARIAHPGVSMGFWTQNHFN